MEILKGVLREELERLKSLKKNYENRLNNHPKGCLIRKEIKGNVYYYLNYRHDGKGVFEYLGRMDKAELLKMNNAIAEKRKIRKLYIQVKKDITKVEKMAYGKKKRKF